MPYIDRAGLEQRFGIDEISDLLDDDAGGIESEADTTSLTRACEDATAMIDGYLSSRYTLPLSSVPDLVVGWAADIARFRLWDEQAPEEVRRRYDDALTQLRDLARGLISLPPGADGETAAEAGFASDGFASDRVFTMESLVGF
jgi:phage gp36-like protein